MEQEPDRVLRLEPLQNTHLGTSDTRDSAGTRNRYPEEPYIQNTHLEVTDIQHKYSGDTTAQTHIHRTRTYRNTFREDTDIHCFNSKVSFPGVYGSGAVSFGTVEDFCQKFISRNGWQFLHNLFLVYVSFPMQIHLDFKSFSEYLQLWF